MKALAQDKKGVVMFTFGEDLAPGKTPEAFLKQWLTLDRRAVPQIEVVRHLEESPREDVAYIVRDRHVGEEKAASIPEMLVAFLKVYPPNRLEATVYREEELPFAFDCPRALLERLGPTMDRGALLWRTQCWLRLLHPLHDGDLIAFQSIVPCGLLPIGAPLRVEFSGQIPVFVALDGQQRYRVPLWRMFPYAYLGDGKCLTK
jgi:hypothetical protein